MCFLLIYYIIHCCCAKTTLPETLLLDSVHQLSNVQLLQFYTGQWAEFKSRVFMSVIHHRWIPIELNKLVCCCWFKYFKLESRQQNWSSVTVPCPLHSLHICLLFCDGKVVPAKWICCLEATAWALLETWHMIPPVRDVLWTLVT